MLRIAGVRAPLPLQGRVKKGPARFRLLVAETLPRHSTYPPLEGEGRLRRAMRSIIRCNRGGVIYPRVRCAKSSRGAGFAGAELQPINTAAGDSLPPRPARIGRCYASPSAGDPPPPGEGKKAPSACAPLTSPARTFRL